MKIYSIKDTKIGFMQTFTANNKAVALRMFADTCNDENTVLAKHPEDYELYELGDFDTDTGNIEPKLLFLERATAFTTKKGAENGN